MSYVSSINILLTCAGISALQSLRVSTRAQLQEYSHDLGQKIEDHHSRQVAKYDSLSTVISTLLQPQNSRHIELDTFSARLVNDTSKILRTLDSNQAELKNLFNHRQKREPAHQEEQSCTLLYNDASQDTLHRLFSQLSPIRGFLRYAVIVPLSFYILCFGLGDFGFSALTPAIEQLALAVNTPFMLMRMSLVSLEDACHERFDSLFEGASDT